MVLVALIIQKVNVYELNMEEGENVQRGFQRVQQ